MPRGDGKDVNLVNELPSMTSVRTTEVLKFTASELFQRLFREGIELVEETAAYLDGDGRSESRLLTRSAALSYASESMKLTTRLMQIASWLLVQRAVNEGNLEADVAFQSRYRLATREAKPEPLSNDLPATLVDYVQRAERLYDRTYYLDQKMYVSVEDEAPINGVLSQIERLRAAFG